MSVIYNSFKKGYKISFTTNINDKIRTFIVKNNFKFTDDEIAEEAIKSMFNLHFFESHIIYNLEEDWEELKRFAVEKGKDYAKSFCNQKPTLKQQLRLERVCKLLNIPYEVQLTNKDIWLKTNELEKELKNEVD